MAAKHGKKGLRRDDDDGTTQQKGGRRRKSLDEWLAAGEENHQKKTKAAKAAAAAAAAITSDPDTTDEYSDASTNCAVAGEGDIGHGHGGYGRKRNVVEPPPHQVIVGGAYGGISISKTPRFTTVFSRMKRNIIGS